MHYLIHWHVRYLAIKVLISTMMHHLGSSCGSYCLNLHRHENDIIFEDQISNIWLLNATFTHYQSLCKVNIWRSTISSVNFLHLSGLIWWTVVSEENKVDWLFQVNNYGNKSELWHKTKPEVLKPFSLDSSTRVIWIIVQYYRCH